MKCKNCKKNCIKKGFYKDVQRYYCKNCKKYHQEKYQYVRCTPVQEKLIVKLNKEGMSIRSISRALALPITSVARNIIRIAKLNKKKT